MSVYYRPQESKSFLEELKIGIYAKKIKQIRDNSNLTQEQLAERSDTHWEVQLTGDSSDLGMLAATFGGPDLRIERREREAVMSSTAFEAFTSAGEVREEAKEIVVALSGLARVVLGSHRRLDVDAVWRVREDGKREITVFPEPAVMRMSGRLATVVLSSDGKTEVHRPADPIAAWLPLVHRDPRVAKALRLRDKDSSLNWVELYRIYEVIKADVGASHMIEFGWITKKKDNQFTHTANSVDAAGDNARHGSESTDPPPSPLSLRQGRELVDRILLEWLKWKTAQLSSSP